MEKDTSLRKLHLEILEKEASGNGLCGDITGFIQRSKRILSYVSRTPENSAELEVHRLFLALCRHEDTGARRMLDFWTEISDSELKAYCLAGKMPENLSEISNYKLLVYFSRTFHSESCGFTDHIKKHFAFAIREFLFRAEDIRNALLEGFYRRTRDDVKGIETFIALAANEHNLIFFHHPDLTLEEAASSLRDLQGWWMNI